MSLSRLLVCGSDHTFGTALNGKQFFPRRNSESGNLVSLVSLGPKALVLTDGLGSLYGTL